MTQKQAQEARERCEKATAGPWEKGYVSGRCNIDHFPHGNGDCVYDYHIEDADHSVVQRREYPSSDGRDSNDVVTLIAGMWDYEEGGIRRPEDAHFIAHSRTDLPAALNMLERAAKIVESFRNGCACSQDYICTTHLDAHKWLQEWRGEA